MSVRRSAVAYRRAMRVFIVVMALLASATLAAARDLALVSNKANTVNAVTLADLVKICKAQTNRWPDGKPVTFVMLAPTQPEMKTLVEKIYEMPEGEIVSLITTANHGRANHPAIVVANSEDDLVNKVASIPGAIGVVDVYSINSSVAVIKIAGKLPLEPGYPLHGN